MRTLWIVTPVLVALGSLALARTASAADVQISWSDTKQTIDGYGASSAWFGVNLSEDITRQLFDPKTGIGLSLLRVQVGLPSDLQSDGSEPLDAGKPVPTMPELSTAKQAMRYGCRIWATAWTPPPAWKTTNNQNGSGEGFTSNKLKREHYQDFADYLADFVDMMDENEIDLIGLSPANEPDYTASWDNAQWTGDELATFVADNLGPTFEARCPSVKIIVPDTATWAACDRYVTPIAENAKALKYAGVFATHPYPNGTVPPDWGYNKPQQLGRPFWQTEWSQENNNGDTPDPSMTSAIDMVTHLHTNMVITQMNAWNWWAIYISADSLISGDKSGTRENPALIQPDANYGRPYMFQRGYALGNWAKFVRPGFKRLGTTDPSSSLLVEAYRDACHVAVIAINTDSNDVSQKFVLSDAPGLANVTPWVTSANDKLAAKSAVPVSDGSFTYTIPAKSIVTFVNWDATTFTPGDQNSDGSNGCTAGGADAGTQTGTGGGAAQGGTAAVGGAAAIGGAAAAGGTQNASAASNDDSGCGCRVAGTSRSSRALGVAAGLVALLSLRRRKNSTSRRQQNAR